MTTSEMLSFYMEKHSLSQRDVARILDISQAHVCKILNYSVFASWKLAKKLAEEISKTDYGEIRSEWVKFTTREMLVSDIDYRMEHEFDEVIRIKRESVDIGK